MGRGQGALGACGERGVFCLETEEQAPTFLGRDGAGAMENPGQAGSLGAHAETNRAVWSARARGSQALDPALTSKIYETVEQSVAEPAACWGKARPLQPPAQPYAREYHKPAVRAVPGNRALRGGFIGPYVAISSDPSPAVGGASAIPRLY